MIKSLSALCMLRCLVLRDLRLYFTGNGCCIDHNVFCFSRMYVHSMDHKFSTCRVEIFISYFALISAIYRICKICFEIIQIKQFRPTSDFFIRRKSYPDISVRDSFFLVSSTACIIAATPALSSEPSSVVPSVVINVLPFKEARCGKSSTFI